MTGSIFQKTTAYHRLKDDVPYEVKLNRVALSAELFRSIADELHKKEIGKLHLVLIEGVSKNFIFQINLKNWKYRPIFDSVSILQNSKRSDKQLVGRNDNNIKVIIPKYEIPDRISSSMLKNIKPGDYVCVEVILLIEKYLIRNIPIAFQIKLNIYLKKFLNSRLLMQILKLSEEYHCVTPLFKNFIRMNNLKRIPI